MAKNDKNSNLFQLYDLCNEFYKNEQHLLKGEKDNINICYLIESKSIESLKKQILYDTLKKDIENNISKENFITSVKNLNIKIKKDLKPEIFKTSDELVKALNKGKNYYYTKQSLALKICKQKELDKSKLKYLFYQNKIKFIFDDNSEIKIYNNYLGLIKSSLIVNDAETNNNQEINNSNSYGNEKLQEENHNIKDNLEILIRLFYFNKFLKEKDNSGFKPENNQSVYLINNDLLEKYKSFYYYNELENYLLSAKNDSYINGVDFISEQSIQKLISALPEKYIIIFILFLR